MTHSIRGLLSAKGEFGWSVFLLIVLPALPLVVEFLINSYSLEPATVFLTATMYTVSHVFTSNKFWILLSGSFCAALLLFCFGQVTADNADYLRGSGEGFSAGDLTLYNSFTGFMYYISFAIMAFFGYQHTRQRWILHMVELEPFFIFNRANSD